MLLARSEQWELLHSALIGILLAMLITTAVALLWMSSLGLGAFYLPKTLAVFIAGAALILHGLPKHHPFDSMGLANQATIARSILVALLAGLIGERTDGSVAAVATAAAVIATTADGVDGWLARRTNMASAFGARFDLETDALLILVLATLAWRFGKAGAWVLLSGLLRYAFVAAGLLMPGLRRPLFPSQRRKAIAVVQMVALIVAIAPFVPPMLSVPVAAIALLALALSFLLDVAWLRRQSAGSRVIVSQW